MNFIELVAEAHARGQRRAEIEHVLLHGGVWARLRLWWRLWRERP